MRVNIFPGIYSMCTLFLFFEEILHESYMAANNSNQKQEHDTFKKLKETPKICPNLKDPSDTQEKG